MKSFAITMGEPAGIGGELTLKAWADRAQYSLPPFFAIDDPERLQEINPDIPVQIIDRAAEAVDVFDRALPVLPVRLKEKSVAGVLNPENGRSVLASISMAVDLSLAGEAAGVVTNPIHKASLYGIGFKHPGHTEFIADMCYENGGGERKTPVMLLTAEGLRVVPLTVHIPLKDVSSEISQDLICEKARILHAGLQKDLGINVPRIVVAGLNPHAGEGGQIGREDLDLIVPAIEKLKAENIDISGPYSPDTLFHEEARSHYDAALCMYHDQALIPLKTIGFYGGVNVTMGLPVVRTSPDHGTALNIAGKGIARVDSFINAIKKAEKIAVNRMRLSAMNENRAIA